MPFRRYYTKFSQASVLIPVYTGIRNYKALTLPFKVLFYFFVLSTLFEIQASISIEMYKNNMPGQHVFTLIQFLVFSTVFYLLTRNNWLKVLIVLNAGIFIIVAINAMCQSMKVPNDAAFGYCTFFLTLYTLVYLHYLFTRDDTRFLWEYPMFWICIGILIYFTGHALAANMKQYLMKEDMNIASIFDDVHTALNIIANCLYAKSFTCLGKQQKIKA